MKSPFDIVNNAFEPFYDQVVAVEGQLQSTSVKACIFEEDFDDPLSEVSPSADRKRVQVFVPKHNEGGWNFETPPKKGDVLVVTSWGGMRGTNKFAIETVHDFMDSWRISAREVQR